MTRPTGRECGCPSWVHSCVHFDGVILILGEGGSVCPKTGEPHPSTGFLVATGFAFADMPISQFINGDLVPSPCHCSGLIGVNDGVSLLDFDAARAEFERRREALRTGA